MQYSIPELIKALDVFDGRYKRAELEAAIAIKEEITPHLLQILKTVGDDPVLYAKDGHYANVYAATLLAYFQEPAAHSLIIRAVCIPEEEREELWGDMVTETLPALLLKTCNGSFEAIQGLIQDKSVYSYVRGAALEAMTFAVAAGLLDREKVVAYFLGLFTGDEDEKGSYFWSNLVALLCDLHPEGAMEAIRQAYEDGLVDPDYVGLDEVEKELRRDRAEVMAELHREVARRVPDDIHGYCSWFSCFEENENTGLALRTAGKGGIVRQKSKKKQSRSRNKIARRSRKRNKR